MADLQIKGGSSRPRDTGEPGLKTFFFRPFGPRFGLKIRGGGGGGVPGPPGTSPPTIFVVEPGFQIQFHLI